VYNEIGESYRISTLVLFTWLCNGLTQIDNTNTEDYIFFRWDKRFVINSGKGKINGVYSNLCVQFKNTALNQKVWNCIIDMLLMVRTTIE